MSLQTELLKLFQYEESDGSKTFNLDLALNENWKKIDDYLKRVLLSDLGNADDATLQAVKAIVLSMVANNLTTTAANLLLDARQGKALGDAMNAHLANKGNPHGVTLAQLGAAAASHTHDIADLISGVLGVIFGGTGASSFTANHPLFGNGKGALKALAPLAAMALLGDGYSTCATAAATTAKVVTLANFTRRTGSRVTVYFTNAVPAGATMNVNSTGAAAMRYKGAAIPAGLIKAGVCADFVFDGSYWNLIGTSNAPMNIVTGSYTGATTSANIDAGSRTFTFGFEPKLLIIAGGGDASVIVCNHTRAITYRPSNFKAINVSVSKTGVTLSGAHYIGNLDNAASTYKYVAIG